LEAIVKGAFPNENIKTASDLVELGNRMGYAMPDISDAARPMVRIEELVRQPIGTTDTAKSQRSASFSGRAETPTSARTRSNSEEPNVSLVKDTAGNEHYIGPSGTLNFLSRLRKLVDEQQEATDSHPAEPDGAVNKFSQDDTAQALEVDDEPEPSNTENTSPNTTGDSVSLAYDGQSPGSITSIARDFTRLPTTDIDEILRQFPADETLEALIASYFKHVHDDFPLFHRATFEDEYEGFVVQARKKPHIAKSRDRQAPDWGWIGCLHMVLVFGSISDPRIPGVNHHQLRRRSVTMARALLPQFISKCTLTNVRVLLLLSFFLHNNNERNAAWNLVGAATRISFALGLHRSDMNSSFRPLEREVRKWVFCTLYAFEQFLASSLGRPSGLQEVDVEIVPPREGFLDGGNGTDAKLVSLSLKLQAILARTRLIHITRRKAELVTPYVPSPTVDEVLESLDEWKRNIAQQPGFDLPWIKDSSSAKPDCIDAMDLDDLKTSLTWKTRAQLRAVLLLHIQFHYIAIVATRPILLRDITMLRKSETPPDTPVGLLSSHAERCVKSARQLAFLVLLLDSFEILNGLSGLDVFYAYCAGMVLILRLLRLPKNEEFHSPSTGPELHVQEEQIHKSIRHLVSRVQQVISCTEKGGSMKRFARVVDAFSDCVDKPTQRARSITQGVVAPGMQQQLPHHRVRFEDGTKGYDAPPPIQGQGFQPNMVPGQNQFASFAPFGDVNMDGVLNLFPYAQQPVTNNDGTMAQFTPQEDIPMQGWIDMEGLLGGYGVQG
jgi:hypothetical protein